MLLAWATDIHLDMTGDLFKRLKKLSEESKSCDGLLLTGDISVSSLLLQHLSLIESHFEKPIYFVLGNHDFYGSSIGSVRRRVIDHCMSSSYLKYMTSMPFVKLEEGTYLIGHDNWYDAQNGNPHNAELLMNDWIQIQDFNSALRGSFGGRVLDKGVIINVAQKLAQQAANHVANSIKAVVKSADHIVVMTHVPPFKESFNATKQGVDSVMNILPWYTSKIMGDTIISAARTYPHIKFTVLSGHAHSHYDDDLMNNLNVKVGRAIYGNPQLANSLTI